MGASKEKRFGKPAHRDSVATSSNERGDPTTSILTTRNEGQSGHGKPQYHLRGCVYAYSS